VRRFLLVGLTGSIATGKSTVSRMFAHLGARVIDADLLAREVVMPGQPAYAKAKLEPELKPRKIHNELRALDILAAMERRIRLSQPVPREWVEELYDLVVRQPMRHHQETPHNNADPIG